MSNIIPATYDTYIAMIKNSVGSNMFRNCYLLIDDKKTDSTKDGRASCAFFVSSILVILKLIKEIHVTVAGTIRDLENSAWKKIDDFTDLKIGDVIVWEKSAIFGDHETEHLGFYIGDNLAISNFYEKQTPQIHHLTYGVGEDGEPKRKIDQVWRYSFNK